MDNEKITISESGDKEQEFTVIDGGVTSDQIAGWKTRCGRVMEVSVEDPEFKERHVGYFRRPDMKTMQAFSATAKANEAKAAEVFFDNCWLGGSQLMKTDAVYKMQATGELQDIFGKCVSKLKTCRGVPSLRGCRD